MTDLSVAAGDPIAHAARIKAQEELLEAAEGVLDWLYDRRVNLPEELLDHREGRHRKALRETIRRVREDERPLAPDPQDYPTEADRSATTVLLPEDY